MQVHTGQPQPELRVIHPRLHCSGAQFGALQNAAHQAQCLSGSAGSHSAVSCRWLPGKRPSSSARPLSPFLLVPFPSKYGHLCSSPPGKALLYGKTAIRSDVSLQALRHSCPSLQRARTGGQAGKGIGALDGVQGAPSSSDTSRGFSTWALSAHPAAGLNVSSQHRPAKGGYLTEMTLPGRTLSGLSGLHTMLRVRHCGDIEVNC